MVATQLGYDPFDAAAEVQVAASIERVQGRLEGRVTIRRTGEPPGERRLEATNDCASLASAIALTVAGAIDTLQPPASAAPPPPPPPTSSPTSAPERALPPSPSPSPSRSPSVRFSASPTATAGIAPAVAPGAAISVGLRWTSVSLSLEGRFDLPAGAPLSIGGEVNTSVALGMLVPCAHVRAFVLCTLVAAGPMRGESTGVQVPGSDNGIFGGAGARVGVEVPLSRVFAVRPQIDGLAAWSRPNLRFNQQAIWTAPVVSGTLGLAFVLQLGDPPL